MGFGSEPRLMEPGLRQQSELRLVHGLHQVTEALAILGRGRPRAGRRRSSQAHLSFIVAGPKKPDDYNVSSLLRTLRHKDSWRCTCKNTQPAPKMRAKSAIAGKSHDPKCMLQRTVFGERRWDGKNLGITLEQLQYLADRNLY